ncbi:hypothetical protein RBA41_22865 [Massilia sp. CCM 9210]|uniref:hypothetical protein n=1 Tax=Massilia scottii TaxID=3057166 RepID=UPI00279642F4|nr:hypothetical protein [Massilia sp. CCM 9210]MDQ1816144.1 hypothetical protein [Massilia sp. CCM 9210]
MPFTPFHLGPGAAMKAVGGRHFSFMVFGGAQVLIDIEPLVGLIQGADILHGPTHTLAGALLIGGVAALTGKPVSEFVLRHLNIPHQRISWLASCTGAFLGTLSHIVLDAIMHSDMHPWRPLSDANPLLDLVSLGTLHLACLLGVVLWGALEAARQLRRRRNGAGADHQ